MVKTLGLDKNGIRKGAWSDEEDEKLRAYIHRYGHWNWSLLPKFAGRNHFLSSWKLVYIHANNCSLILIFRFVKKWEELQVAMGQLSSSGHETWELY